MVAISFLPIGIRDNCCNAILQCSAVVVMNVSVCQLEKRFIEMITVVLYVILEISNLLSNSVSLTDSALKVSGANKKSKPRYQAQYLYTATAKHLANS